MAIQQPKQTMRNATGAPNAGGVLSGVAAHIGASWGCVCVTLKSSLCSTQEMGQIPKCGEEKAARGQSQ